MSGFKFEVSKSNRKTTATVRAKNRRTNEDDGPGLLRLVVKTTVCSLAGSTLVRCAQWFILARKHLLFSFYLDHP
jgi:hypothetical protein